MAFPAIFVASYSLLLPGTLMMPAGRTAVGQAGANQAYGQLESGYRFDLGTNAEAYLTPFARLQGYTGTQGAFTESGAQSLNLNVAAQTTNSLRTSTVPGTTHWTTPERSRRSTKARCSPCSRRLATQPQSRTVEPMSAARTDPQSRVRIEVAPASGGD